VILKEIMSFYSKPSGIRLANSLQTTPLSLKLINSYD